MAHFKKLTVSAADGILKHDRRITQTSKSRIDPDRTYLNRCIDQGKYPDHVIAETGARCLKRADVNKMISLIVTCPREITDWHEQLRFFQACIRHMRADLTMYAGSAVGEIGAFCHFDETTPHLHYDFVPLVKDRKHDGLKVSAKEWLTKEYLIGFHGALERDVSRELGYKVELQHDDVRQRMKARGVKNLDIREYREQKEVELEQLEKLVSQKKVELQKMGVSDPEQYLQMSRSAQRQQIEDIVFGR